MTGRENLYAVVFFAAVSFGSVLVSAAVWPRRNTSRAATSLTVFMLALAWWCAAYGLSFGPVSIERAGFWLDQTYWGLLTAPTAMLFFIARFTGLDAWLSPWVARGMAAIPAAFAVAIFAPPFRSGFLGAGRNPVTAVLDHPGTTYWVYVGYATCVLIANTAMVVRFARRESARRRRTAALLVFAMALPWVANIASSANHYLLNMDPTVLSLSASAAIFAYLVLSQEILSVGELAREQILHAMQDGFIAVDDQQRVVDINERALQLLALPLEHVLNAPVMTALAERKELLDAAFVNGGGLVRVNQSAPEHLIRVETIPLNDRTGSAVGTVVVLRDQTRMYVDELTHIGNRRYFFDQVPNLVTVCQRSGLPVSLAIFDLDGLKAINDGHGHPAGDRALTRVAAALRAQVRAVDVVARMSGDEFVVLMPDANEEQAAAIAERIRQALTSDPFEPGLSVSAGVAQISADDSLLHAIAVADRALYSAKARGRDRVVRFSEGENQP